MDNLLGIFALAFATWRISRMFSDVLETGPFDMLTNFRHWTGVRYDGHSNPYGENWFSRGLLCMKCFSIWIGSVIALSYFLFPETTTWLMLPFVLSGIALLVDDWADW